MFCKLLLPLSILALIASAHCASAEWSVTGIRDETTVAAGIVHRRANLASTDTGDSAVIDLAIFSQKSGALRVIDNGDKHASLAEAMSSSNCVAGINGGYFDPEFRPIGLRIVDAKTIAPMGHGRLMSGIISSNGSVQLVRVAEFSPAHRPQAALECGPMLIDAGKPVRGLEASRDARRTFVAVDKSGRIALGSSSSVTLSQIAAILTDSLGDFKTRRALNLDGGSSSAFWFKRDAGSTVSIPEEKTVRDFIGIVPRR